MRWSRRRGRCSPPTRPLAARAHRIGGRIHQDVPAGIRLQESRPAAPRVRRRRAARPRAAVRTARAASTTTASTGPNGNPVLVSVRDLPASERFFAGGDTTIRGFALDTRRRAGDDCHRRLSAGRRRGDRPQRRAARARSAASSGRVLFVDGGNVFARTTDIDLGELRGSVGFGVRYRSPIGPIRLDVGFKLDRRMIGTSSSRATRSTSRSGRRSDGMARRRIVILARADRRAVARARAGHRSHHGGGERAADHAVGRRRRDRSFGLIAPPAGTADPLAFTLDRLIERMLILAEVERFQPPEPDPIEITIRVDAVEQRLGRRQRSTRR